MMSLNTSNVDTVVDLVQRMKHIGIIDYGIFIIMMGLSSAIGLYFGIRDKYKNQQSIRRCESIEMDYMVGGRKMKIFPTAMSLAASSISGIAVLGMATEMYVYGTEFVFFIVGVVISGVFVHFLFIPVYLELKLTSQNEYLEARFDRKMRYFGAIIFILATIFSLPILLYSAVLAFNQVSGINIHLISTITCLICVFYTTIGGMKAVIWTDVVQITIMYGTLLLIVVKGTLAVGGFNTVWNRNYESGRIEFPSLTFDLTVRHSIFAVIIGGTFLNAQLISVNQLFIQRYVSLPSSKAARQALWIFIIAITILFLLCFYNGLLIYATYYDCDPKTTKLVKSNDQLLPLLVMDVLNDFPGIAGLFLTGIFSASLSTLSTAFNSLSTVIMVDFVKILTTKPLSKLTTNIVMRGVVLISGLICIGLVFVVEKFDTVFQFKMTIASCTSGPLFGIFLIGLLLPWINSNSALFGGTLSLMVMIWITIKGQMAILSKEVVFEQKPTSTYGCTYNYHSVMRKSIVREDSVAAQQYNISYMWYVFVGVIITIIGAGLASIVFGRQNPRNVNPVLLAPFIRKYFKDQNGVPYEKNIKTYQFPSSTTLHY